MSFEYAMVITGKYLFSLGPWLPHYGNLPFFWENHFSLDNPLSLRAHLTSYTPMGE